MFKLQPLPYAYGALQPVLSTRSVQQHYEGNHAGYVRKLNELVAQDLTLQGLSLSRVIASTRPGTAVHNFAAQNWNHNFYWKSMCPVGRGGSQLEVGGPLESLAFQESFIQAGTQHFGNGWVWLVQTHDRQQPFKIRVTSDAGMPPNTENPLLVCDLWEHAYVCDYGNTKRENYIRAWFDIVNWNVVRSRLRGDWELTG